MLPPSEEDDRAIALVRRIEEGVRFGGFEPTVWEFQFLVLVDRTLERRRLDSTRPPLTAKQLAVLNRIAERIGRGE